MKIDLQQGAGDSMTILVCKDEFVDIDLNELYNKIIKHDKKWRIVVYEK